MPVAGETYASVETKLAVKRRREDYPALPGEIQSEKIGHHGPLVELEQVRQGNLAQASPFDSSRVVSS